MCRAANLHLLTAPHIKTFSIIYYPTYNYEPSRYWLVKKFESENKVVIGKNLSL